MSAGQEHAAREHVGEVDSAGIPAAIALDPLRNHVYAHPYQCAASWTPPSREQRRASRALDAFFAEARS